ncbi:MAG: hypothetical protein H6810_04125 [Phycisphaeraceae bacterium]|nr:MAG: hypothetical protein H6810_04125 [Phycisphaeraceae bacterium]
MVAGMNSWIPDGIELVPDNQVQAAMAKLDDAAAHEDWSAFTHVWDESEIIGGLFQSINFRFTGDSGQASRDDFRKRVWAFEEHLDRYRK